MPSLKGCLIGCCLLVAACAAQASTDVCGQRAADILQALQKGDYAAATTHFNARIKAAVDAQRLDDIWSRRLPQQFGAFDRSGDSKQQPAAGGALVETPLHFAHGWLAMRVGCDGAGEVNGLHFAPMADPTAAQSLAPNERALDVPSPLGLLPGIVTLPTGPGPFPAVVLVAGSGPHDGDETIGPNKPFRDIAQGLAAAGVASLRYDKRTYTYGAQLQAQAGGYTIDQEVTDDALSAVKQLRAQAGIDPHRLFVLGHSLGAYMAPRIGQRDPQLAGLILLAAPTRTLLDVQAWQARELGKTLGLTDEQIRKSVQAVADERLRLAKADPAQPMPGMFSDVPQSYWLSLRDYDQVSVAKGLAMPLFIVQGGKDFQVSPVEDFAQWQQALADRPQVSFHLYEGLSHLFMPAGKGTLADYQVPGHVDSGVIRDVANWLKAQPASR
ncbi:MAG TPA: alpha/beta fold hydrolase [Dyella sp.]|uniref:alpha/beta hydrolase n=1 Tax=Dyella sp. TaxID=1869338 RepID=UPI002D79C654|nr:alpha/beta fold hydrolase [Dyella sp.]HET6554457.1 alpha/beta fold hydrolase [Dyella sp.]